MRGDDIYDRYSDLQIDPGRVLAGILDRRIFWDRFIRYDIFCHIGDTVMVGICEIVPSVLMQDGPHRAYGKEIVLRIRRSEICDRGSDDSDPCQCRNREDAYFFLVSDFHKFLISFSFFV